MRMSVGELIAELQKTDPSASVKFQIDVDKEQTYKRNGVQRVDNFGTEVVVVLDTRKTEV